MRSLILLKSVLNIHFLKPSSMRRTIFPKSRSGHLWQKIPPSYYCGIFISPPLRFSCTLPSTHLLYLTCCPSMKSYFMTLSTLLPTSHTILTLAQVHFHYEVLDAIQQFRAHPRAIKRPQVLIYSRSLNPWSAALLFCFSSACGKSADIWSMRLLPSLDLYRSSATGDLVIVFYSISHSPTCTLSNMFWRLILLFLRGIFYYFWL